MLCWICNLNDAKSHEHIIKKSDLKSEVPLLSQNNPIYLSDTKGFDNKKIYGLNNKFLKYQQPICHDCNSSKTQKYDRAWEEFSKKLKELIPKNSLENLHVRFNKIFPSGSRDQMLNVHLFFVKLFGCKIKESGVPIDITPFSQSIITQIAHPNVYLDFKHRNQLITLAESSQVYVPNDQDATAFAIWDYCIGNIVVHIMYALPNEQRNGLKLAWHPKFNTKKFIFAPHN